MTLREVTVKDKDYINGFLKLSHHMLSVYNFNNIYCWKKLFNIFSTEIRNCLCIFFKDKNGIFLYLSPLGRTPDNDVINEVFGIMDKMNHNKSISRIENVSEGDIGFYKNLGYECVYKSCDYICKREDIAGLKGNRYKHKRSSFNYFIKHYKYEYLPFAAEYKKDCQKLYDIWMGERKSKNADFPYQYMLMDNRNALEILLEEYEALDWTGRIVKIDGEIKAFTFGFELDEETFCVFYEIAELSFKGLSQFIFREFTRELKYKYINIMDDSGLDNLRRVKLSYYPFKIASSFSVRQK